MTLLGNCLHHFQDSLSFDVKAVLQILHKKHYYSFHEKQKRSKTNKQTFNSIWQKVWINSNLLSVFKSYKK